MQALILVGGHGTRLRPVTLTLPKPVIPLVDRPFLRYMIDWLARHGVDDIVMACGFLPDGIRAALGDEIPGGPAPALRRGARAARHRRRDQVRRGPARGPLLRAQRRRAHRPRPDRAARARTRPVAPGRRSALYPVDGSLAPTASSAGARRRDHRVPREARSAADRHRRGLRRRLRAREGGARPGPRGPGRLDRARGLPAAGRQRALLRAPRGLLDGHRDARSATWTPAGTSSTARSSPSRARRSTTMAATSTPAADGRGRAPRSPAHASSMPTPRSAPASRSDRRP